MGSVPLRKRPSTDLVVSWRRGVRSLMLILLSPLTPQSASLGQTRTLLHRAVSVTMSLNRDGI